MKRYLFGIMSLLCATLVFAQDEEDSFWWEDRRHSIDISVGLPSLYSTIAGSHSWSFYIAPPGSGNSPSPKRNSLFCGHYSIDYSYNVLRWLAVGAELNYEYWTGDYTTHDTYLAAKVKFTYINREHITLYSGVGVGVGTHVEKNSNGSVQGIILPAAVLTPIGIHAGGRHVYGLAEVNVGSSSFFRLGIGGRF